MITKADAVARLTATEEAEFKMWEARIDSVLSTFSGSASVEANGLSFHVRVRLMEHYRKGGWTVEHTDYQRDGAFLNFR